jgi:hypothetical protein
VRSLTLRHASERVSCTRSSLYTYGTSAYRANSDAIDRELVIVLIERSHIVRKHVRDGVKYPQAILGCDDCPLLLARDQLLGEDFFDNHHRVFTRGSMCISSCMCEVGPVLHSSRYGLEEMVFSSTGPTYHRLFSSTRTTHPRCYHHVHNSNTWHTYTFMRMKLR